MSSLMNRAFFILLVGIPAGLAAGWFYRDPLLEKGIEAYLNETQAVFFNQSLKVEGVHLDRDLKLSIRQIRGDWQTAADVFSFETDDIRLEDPVTHFFLGKPVTICFGRFRPRGSVQPGIAGKVLLHLDKDETMDLDADFLGLALEELRAIDPENLRGATGQMTGQFHLRARKSGSQDFRLKLNVPPPGGTLQARFFDLLLPYIPPAQKAVLETINTTQTVQYQEADLNVALASPEAVNLLLHIAVPDYHLNLNLNVTIRVEDQEAFLQLAALLGLMKVEAA